MHVLSRSDDLRPDPTRLADVVLRGLPQWARFGWLRRQLIDQALDRERWTAEQWRSWRDVRASQLLERAATRVPFYREQWARRRRQGDRASFSYLENWPVLEREAVRAQPASFVADDCRVERMQRERTAGTSGAPLDVWWSRRAAATRDTLMALRTSQWYGIGSRDRGATVTGSESPPIEPRRRSAARTATSHHLLLPFSHPTPDVLQELLATIVQHGVTHLVGRPSVLHLLATEVLRQGRADLRVRLVLTEGEALTAEMRCLLGEAFRCPVRETFRMAEMVTAASECLDGRLHEWSDVGIVEVLDGARPAEVDALGDLVCTGLLNVDMPLIRYRVGDRVRLRLTTYACRCGRALPAFVHVEGRSTGATATGNGGRGLPGDLSIADQDVRGHAAAQGGSTGAPSAIAKHAAP